MNPDFVTLLYVANIGNYTRLEAFVCDLSLYERFKNGAISNQHPEDDQDSLESIGAVLYHKGEEAWFQEHASPTYKPLEVRKAFLNRFMPGHEYSDEDVVVHENRLYHRKYPGSSIVWNPDDWDVINSGDLLSTLSVYKDGITGRVKEELPKGIFFWSERVTFQQFSNDMVIYDDLILFDGL